MCSFVKRKIATWKTPLPAPALLACEDAAAPVTSVKKLLRGIICMTPFPHPVRMHEPSYHAIASAPAVPGSNPLYGTAVDGGNGSGVVFSLKP